jgi:hypothetical protein
MRRFVWTTGETPVADTEVGNFGPGPIHNAALE